MLAITLQRPVGGGHGDCAASQRGAARTGTRNLVAFFCLVFFFWLTTAYSRTVSLVSFVFLFFCFLW